MAKINAIKAQLDAAAAGRGQPIIKQDDALPERRTIPKPKSREGRVHIGAWLPEAYVSNILMLRSKTRWPVKTVIATALNELFQAHGIPVIDED